MVHKKWVLMILIIDYNKKKTSSECNACEMQLPDVARTKQSEFYATVAGKNDDRLRSGDITFCVCAGSKNVVLLSAEC